MKIGDIVRVFDGSYAMAHDGDHNYYSISGTVAIADGDYEVVGVGEYPLETDNWTSEYLGKEKQVNNLMLRCVMNPERIVYSQKRFCSVKQTA